MYLADHIDILIGMGTSALEGAKLGVPTILVDAWESFYPVGYKYIWLFEAETFVLGERFWIDADFEKGHKLVDMLHVLDNATALSRISDLCFMYSKLHSIEMVGPKFLELSTNAKLTVTDLRWLFHYVDFKSKLYELVAHRK